MEACSTPPPTAAQLAQKITPGTATTAVIIPAAITNPARTLTTVPTAPIIQTATTVPMVAGTTTSLPHQRLRMAGTMAITASSAATAECNTTPPSTDPA